MKRKHWLLGIAGLGVLIGIGCGGKAEFATEASKKMESRPPAYDALPSAPMGGGANTVVAQSPAMTRMAKSKDANSPEAKTEEAVASDDYTAVKLTTVAAQEPDRYLIKNATITIEMDDVRKGNKELITLVRSLKGYSANAHETADGLGQRSIEVQVRVPFTQFDNVMQQIEALGKVLDKKVEAEDVTEEFVDTQAKTRNLKRTESRLLEHLAKTGKLADTLSIERELTRVRQEIEGFEGRLRYLANRVSFSSITVTLKETPRALPVTPQQSFSSGRVASDAGRSLVEFMQGIWAQVIWLAIWSVVWLPPVVLGTIFVRRHLKGLKRTLAPNPLPNITTPPDNA